MEKGNSRISIHWNNINTSVPFSAKLVFHPFRALRTSDSQQMCRSVGYFAAHSPWSAMAKHTICCSLCTYRAYIIYEILKPPVCHTPSPSNFSNVQMVLISTLLLTIWKAGVTQLPQLHCIPDQLKYPNLAPQWMHDSFPSKAPSSTARWTKAQMKQCKC